MVFSEGTPPMASISVSGQKKPGMALESPEGLILSATAVELDKYLKGEMEIERCVEGGCRVVPVVSTNSLSLVPTLAWEWLMFPVGREREKEKTQTQTQGPNGSVHFHPDYGLLAEHSQDKSIRRLLNSQLDDHLLDIRTTTPPTLN